MKNLIILLLCTGLLSCHFGQENSIANYSTLPSFDMLLTDSTTLLHARDIPVGKPLVLVYFRPDCPHCQVETKSILNDIDSLRNFQICLLANAPIEDLRIYSQYYHLNQYTNIIIGKDYQNSFAHVFKPNAVPFVAIYNEKRKLAKIYYGEISVNTLVTAIHS